MAGGGGCARRGRGGGGNPFQLEMMEGETRSSGVKLVRKVFVVMDTRRLFFGVQVVPETLSPPAPQVAAKEGRSADRWQEGGLEEVEAMDFAGDYDDDCPDS